MSQHQQFLNSEKVFISYFNTNKSKKYHATISHAANSAYPQPRKKQTILINFPSPTQFLVIVIWIIIWKNISFENSTFIEATSKLLIDPFTKCKDRKNLLCIINYYKNQQNKNVLKNISDCIFIISSLIN